MRPLGEFPVMAVFGSTGFIGRNLLAAWVKQNFKTVGIIRAGGRGFLSLDLDCPEVGALQLKRRGVTHAVIAAAVSRIASCQADPVATRKINVAGTVNLAKQLCGLGIKVIAFSSDYVFDGREGNYGESSPIGPVNEYGWQKVEMERLLRDTCGRGVLILRLSKVFDIIPGSQTLLDEIAGKLMSGQKVLAARDQFFCPVWVEDVAAVTGQLLTSGADGIVHLCAPMKVSRLELAHRMAHALGAEEALVQEISLRDLPEKFSRPLDTSMICERLGQYVSFEFKNLWKCVEELAAKYRESYREDQD